MNAADFMTFSRQRANLTLGLIGMDKGGQNGNCECNPQE
jgi:hypothetical protein